MATEEEAPVKQGNKITFIVDFRVIKSRLTMLGKAKIQS